MDLKNQWIYSIIPIPTTKNLILETKEIFSNKIKDVINVLSLSKKQPPKITGSWKYKIHRYPSDIDLYQKIVEVGGYDKVRDKIVRQIKKMALKISETHGMYLHDFKAGFDSRYFIPIGWITSKGKIIGYNPDKILEKMILLFQQKLLTKTEFDNWTDLVKLNPEINDYINLRDKIKTKRILRWNLQNLIDGWIDSNGSKIYLKDAISHNTIVKIDILTKISGRYTEVTNWYVFYAGSKLINKEHKNYQAQIETDIMIFLSKKKYLKIAKRLWILAIATGNDKLIVSLSPLFYSSIALLNKAIAEFEALKGILEKVRMPPLKSISNQLDWLRDTIGVVPDSILPSKTVIKISDMISVAILNITDKNVTSEIISEITEILSEIVDRVAEGYLNEIRIL